MSEEAKAMLAQEGVCLASPQDRYASLGSVEINGQPVLVKLMYSPGGAGNDAGALRAVSLRPSRPSRHRCNGCGGSACEIMIAIDEDERRDWWISEAEDVDGLCCTCRVVPRSQICTRCLEQEEPGSD